MKLNRASYDNMPEMGTLCWFMQDSSGGGNIADKNWVLSMYLWPTNSLHATIEWNSGLVTALIRGHVVRYCNVGRFHIGDMPPTEE